MTDHIPCGDEWRVDAEDCFFKENVEDFFTGMCFLFSFNIS